MFTETFDRALQAAKNKTPAGDGGVQYSFADFDKPITRADIQNLRTLFPKRKSVNDFTQQELEATAKWAYRYYKQIGTKSPFFRAWFGDWRSQDRSTVNIVVIPSVSDSLLKDFIKNQRSINGIENLDTKQNEKSNGWMIRISGQGERSTESHAGEKNLSYDALTGIQSLIQNAVLLDSEAHEEYHELPNGTLKKAKSSKNDTVAFDHKFYALGKTENGEINLYRITVEDSFHDKTHQQDFLFHNLKYIKKDAENIGGRTGENTRSRVSANDASTTKYSIADLYGFVKKFDTEFNAGREISPLLLNDDGTPKVLYHGSPADFRAFDKKKSRGSNLYGRGFYFTERKSHGQQYGNLYSVYLNLAHPLTPGGNTVTRAQVRAYLKEIASEENEDYDLDNYGYGKTVDEILNTVYREDAFDVIQDINATAIGDFVAAVELFNKVNGTDFDGIRTDTETVAFYANQIKSAETGTEKENIGTFSRYEERIDYSKDLEAQAEEALEEASGQDPAVLEQTELLRERTEKLTDVKMSNAEKASIDPAAPFPVFRIRCTEPKGR